MEKTQQVMKGFTFLRDKVGGVRIGELKRRNAIEHSAQPPSERGFRGADVQLAGRIQKRLNHSAEDDSVIRIHCDRFSGFEDLGGIARVD
jgi:hypothetical protein